MQTALTIANLVVGLLLVLVILMQEKGDGLGEAIGGSSAGGSFQTTKRGAELVLAKATVVFFVAFLAISLVLNFL